MSSDELSLRAWFAEAEAAAGIANQVCSTAFCPDTLKRWKAEGNRKVLDVEATVATVAAALMTGQELGFGPMASLRSIDIIRGTPALRAIALRALVQKHGHDITIVDATEHRAVVRGRRSNGETQQSVWTIDRARLLGVYPGPADGQWRRQPQNMLVARASAEVARWIASDAILGMPYVYEELVDAPYEIHRDEPAEDSPQAAEEAARPKRARTAKRSTRVNASPLALLPPPPPPHPDDSSGTPGPPSPPLGADGSEVPAPAEPAAESEAPPLISRPALAALHIKLREAGLTSSAAALKRISEWAGREVTSTKTLTAAEASAVLGKLADAAAEARPAEEEGDSSADDQ